jgi:16S rRNA (cytosine1402-N4)-methyltransferase
MPSSVHKPVLPREVAEQLAVQPGDIVVDGTLGGGGHAADILERLSPGGHLIAFDRDPDAIERAKSRLDPIARSAEVQLTIVHDSYTTLPEQLRHLGIQGVDGILLDLGLSSDQIDNRDRGFSFRWNGPLDLRFDNSAGETAAEFLARAEESTIAMAISEYGEENFAQRIAALIVARRAIDPIETTHQLADLIRSAVPGAASGRLDPATRTFQALRIAVNQELEHVEEALKVMPNCLNMGGRFVVISFHSLEDRLTKNAFRGDNSLEIKTKKPVMAGLSESTKNPRSKSAKLRAAVKKTI